MAEQYNRGKNHWQLLVSLATHLLYDLALLLQRKDVHTPYTHKHMYDCSESGSNLYVLQQVSRFRDIYTEEHYPAIGWNADARCTKTSHKGIQTTTRLTEHSGKNATTNLDTRALMVLAVGLPMTSQHGKILFICLFVSQSLFEALVVLKLVMFLGLKLTKIHLPLPPCPATREGCGILLAVMVA